MDIDFSGYGLNNDAESGDADQPPGAGAGALAPPHLSSRIAQSLTQLEPTAQVSVSGAIMRSSFTSRFTSMSRLVIITLAMLASASPASAQFGGLKKKIRKATSQDDSQATAPASDPTPAQGGSVVLTADVVSKLITGLKAGEAERDAAARSDDNSYGSYKKAERAYEAAQAKCESQRQAWAMKGNAKESDKASALIEKMLKAQEKQDYKTAQLLQDSVNLLQGGPSCLVKKPEQPKDYYEAEREIDVRAEKAAVKGSGLAPGEYAMAQERAMAILRGGAPTDASPSEKNAVMSKKAALEPLLWPQEKTATRTAKPAAQPAPVPPPTAPQADPQMSAAASDMSSCMMKNVQGHQAQLEALGKRMEATQKAGNQAAMMAIADTVQQIQMAGCMKR
jgi:hypothetical protein